MNSDSVEDGSGTKRRGTIVVARDHFVAEVTESWADAFLILTCFIVGLIDSAVFNVWSCFVSMQTGNTVYVGLGVSGQPASQPYRWAKSLTAIVCFAFGAFFFSRAGRLLGQLRRSTMVLSSVFQALLCFISAALVTAGVVSPDAGDRLPGDCIVLLPLGLLSFQSGGHIVMSRVLGYNEIPTVVLTSTYCDLMIDPNLLTASLTQNVKRNRRFLSAIVMLVGAIAGGFLTADGNIADALWLAGGLKAVMAITWCFWKSQGSVRLE